jgi:LmbE family N-acetylglucosaminyl deacetylase
MVTLFAAGPDRSGPLGPLARMLHDRWRAGADDDIPALRRGEDAIAASALGASAVWLDHREAIYRGDRYSTPAALRGSVHPADETVRAELAAELVALWRRTPAAVVILPLGIGGHVDHRIAHELAPALSGAGATIAFYEDFPYVTIDGALDARRAEIETPMIETRVEVDAVLARRLAAVAAYQLELPLLFRSDGPYPGPAENAIRRYASALSERPGGHAERIWWWSGPDNPSGPAWPNGSLDGLQ